MAEEQATHSSNAGQGDGRSSTWASLRAVARNPNLRRIQLAFLGSSVGDWAYATAIIVWAYGEGGAGAVGVWLGIRFVLEAIAAPIGALVADRWPRKRLMVLCDALRALFVTVAATLIALDSLPLLVFMVATLTSLLSSPFMIAQRALLPSLSETPGELAASNGIHSTIDSLAFFAGPALAAALLALTGVPTVLLLNVATFLWSLALVSRVSVPTADKTGAISGEDDGDPAGGFLAESLAGFRLIRRDAGLLLVTVQVSLQTIIAGAMTVFLIVMADDVLHSPEAGLGLLNSVFGAGAIAGGVVAIARSSRSRLGFDMTVGVALWAIPLLLVTIWPTPAACFAAAILIGLGNPLVDVNLDTIMQRLAPDEVLGRVFGALESCLIATAALGALLMPLLLDLTSLRVGLAVLAVPVAGLALAGLPAMIRLDNRLREPAGLSLLRGLDLFAPLDPGALEQLAHSLTEARFAAGEVLVAEGGESDLFYVIQSGRVEVTQGDRVLRQEGPGEYFGEIGLLRDVPRTATVTALEETGVYALSRADFLGAMSGRHTESRLIAEATVRRRLAT